MGLCLCSKENPRATEDAENRYWVINLNDDGKKICPGVMELTETSLIFYLKKGGFVRWPYVSLVKYGFDSSIFSFVCCERCQTGEGIFAFNCDRAEELFNRLKSNMQRNRISVISDTTYDVPTEGKTLLYRYERYPSFPDASSILSSLQRPEPIGRELTPEPAPSTPAEQVNTMSEDQLKQRRPLSLTKKTSSGGTSLKSTHSYFEMEESQQVSECPAKNYQRPAYVYRNKLEREELQRRGSFYANLDFNNGVWDTGYNSEERREPSLFKSIGYENIHPVSSESGSQSLVASVSSSGSQNNHILPSRVALAGYESQASSPSVFEEKYTLDHKTSTSVSEDHKPALLNRHSSGRDSLTRQDGAVTYFNFDARHLYQEAKKLNYIQVEMESGCDSDNPQTPQSPDASLLTANRASEIYTELDLERTIALSRIHSCRQKDEGTRKTRHNSKKFSV